MESTKGVYTHARDGLAQPLKWSIGAAGQANRYQFSIRRKMLKPVGNSSCRQDKL